MLCKLLPGWESMSMIVNMGDPIFVDSGLYVQGGFSGYEFLWLFDVEYVVVRRWDWMVICVLVSGCAKGVGACLFMYVFNLKGVWV